MPQNRTLTEFAQGRTSRTIDVSDYNYKANLLDFRSTMQRTGHLPEGRRTSFEELVEDNREDFRDRIVADLIKKVEASHLKIKDFNSFKRAFGNAFASDPHGRNFYGGLKDQDDLLMRIFAEPDIQQKVTKDGEASRSRSLAKKYGIDIARAKQLYSQIRRVEIEEISKGWIPESQLKQPRLVRSPTTASRGLQISQRAQSGTLYRRTAPRGFTQPQERFLLNNINTPRSKLTAEFNILFDENRTRNSVYFKQYRLLTNSGRLRLNDGKWAEAEEV
jgi:hypothetical protein